MVLTLGNDGKTYVMYLYETIGTFATTTPVRVSILKYFVKSEFDFPCHKAVHMSEGTQIWLHTRGTQRFSYIRGNTKLATYQRAHKTGHISEGTQSWSHIRGDTKMITYQRLQKAGHILEGTQIVGKVEEII